MVSFWIKRDVGKRECFADLSGECVAEVAAGFDDFGDGFWNHGFPAVVTFGDFCEDGAGEDFEAGWIWIWESLDATAIDEVAE